MSQPIKTPVGSLRKRLAAPRWLGWRGPIWTLRVQDDHYHFRTHAPALEARRALLGHVRDGGWLGPATVRDVIERCGGVEHTKPAPSPL